jgi:hypothetical protein
MNIESFNTERLYNEILSRIPDDPLKINKQNIIDSVLSGSFRVTDIKTLDEKALEIKLDTGIWFTESPYSELYAITEPCEKTIPLTYGFHVLYNSYSKDYYNIYIDENNTVIENHPEKATFP